MDKRRWQRRAMQLDVEVRMWRRHGEQIVHCKTDDISMTGAFIRTYIPGFPKRRLIELRFAILERLKLNNRMVLARVVHKGCNGLVGTKSSTDSHYRLYRMQTVRMQA